MKSILYFHGFASSPASAKITALRPLLQPYGLELNTPDLNVPSFEELDFDRIVERAEEEARKTPPATIVGSSMGALVALAVAKRGFTVPLVLIAPALNVARRWVEHIPHASHVVVYNYATDSHAPIHRAFFEQMATLHIDDDPPPSRVTVIMGRMDETVPFDDVVAAWERWKSSGKLVEGSRFIELEEGDHSLVSHAGIIRNAIRDAAQ